MPKGQPDVTAGAAVDPFLASDRIVMLGVDGGPVIRPGTAKPAVALVVDEHVYLVDCGLDTARQVVHSGLGFGSLRHVFITHNHLDHTSGLPDLVLHGWVARPRFDDLEVWGPPGTARKTSGIEATFEDDIREYSKGEGFGPFPTVTGHDVTVPEGAVAHRVMEDERVVVDATRVFHGPRIEHAYAYRFTVKRTGKVAVFSGDTAAPDENLIRLAQDCDVLVHEVQDNAKIEEIVSRLPAAAGATLREHLFQAHSDVNDVPGVATAARAKKLVFSHYTPTPQPTDTWLAMGKAAAEEAGYEGEVIAPDNLDVVPL